MKLTQDMVAGHPDNDFNHLGAQLWNVTISSSQSSGTVFLGGLIVPAEKVEILALGLEPNFSGGSSPTLDFEVFTRSDPDGPLWGTMTRTEIFAQDDIPASAPWSREFKRGEVAAFAGLSDNTIYGNDGTTNSRAVTLAFQVVVNGGPTSWQAFAWAFWRAYRDYEIR